MLLCGGGSTTKREEKDWSGEPIDSWEEMKHIMRRRYVPNHFQRDIHNKLQRLTQGSKSVDEYFKEMELALLMSNCREDREATIARFLSGLNQEIQDIVELQNYVELEDLVQQAIKVEQQLKRRKYKFRSPPKLSSSSWKGDSKKEGNSSSREIVSTSQGKKPSETSPRSRDVKCFKCRGHGHIASQCPTKRTMVSRNGEVVSQSEASSKEESEEEVFMPDGDLFMVRRLLGGQPKEQDDSQRENIFHSRCLIQGKVCSLIIDGGSCANVVSSRLVSKLKFVIKVHPRPYRLQWLREVGEIIVNKQVEVPFSIGKYEDSVLCDVVPMEASHILLGRPWQHDKKVIHDGFSNKFSLLHQNRKVILCPLSPKQVCEDQVKMREKRKQERKENEREKEIEKRIEKKNDNEIEKKIEKESKKKIEEKGEQEKNSVKNSEKNIVAISEENKSCLARKSEGEKALVSKQSQFIFYCNNFYLIANASNDLPLSRGVVIVLQKFIPRAAHYCNVVVRNTLEGPLIPICGDGDFNSRSNSLKEGGNDVSQEGASQDFIKDAKSLIKSMVQEARQGLDGPKTRTRARKAQQVSIQIMALILIEASPRSRTNRVEPKLITYMIQLKDP